MALVVLGMSGGVDSSVAAHLLKEDGHSVIGVTLVMHPSHRESAKEAAAVALALGIEHRTINLEDDFCTLVLSPFIKEYENGRTPNPCVLCNAQVKFPYLLREAERNGAQYIATGHYAKIGVRDSLPIICAATDTAKDQSYFLYMLGKDVLDRLLLPLCGLTKAQIRELAKASSLPCASKADSQDICFIPDGDTQGFIASNLLSSAKTGSFITADGVSLGTHRGITHYTVGQRKGLGVSYSHPLFVSHIDKDSGDITLCREEELYRRTVYIEGARYFTGKLPSTPFEADVRLRYTRHSAKATVFALGEGRAKIVFNIPQRAPAPGQSAVFFDGEYLLGGGIITGSLV